MVFVSWYNASIKRKIGGLFVLLLSFLLATIVYSIYKIQLIEEEMREVAYLDIPLGQIMNQIEFIELEQHLEFEQVLLGDLDPNALEPHQQFVMEKNKLKQLLDRAINLISDSLNQEALQLNAVEHQQVSASLSDYYQLSHRYEDKLTQVMLAPKAHEQDIEQIETLAAELEALQKQVIERLNQISRRDAYYTEQHEKEFLFVNSALGITALVLGLLLTVYIIRLILTRIRRIQGEIHSLNNSLEHGEPVPAPDISDVDSRDELASLEKDIQRVMLSLSGEMTYREEVEKQLLKLATQDRLTGVFNRHKWEEEIAKQVNLAKRGYQFGLIILDIDHFKRVNDQHGHDAGDQLLKRITATISERLRKTDMLFRIGGEEFAIILPMLDKSALEAVAESLQSLIESKRYEDLPPVTVSLGVTTFREFDDEISLFKRADSALYDAKRLGRNQVVYRE